MEIDTFLSRIDAIVNRAVVLIVSGHKDRALVEMRENEFTQDPYALGVIGDAVAGKVALWEAALTE